MPRLPKNLVKRGGAYYFREQVSGRVRRISLGRDRDIAIARLRSLKTGVTNEPASELSVDEASRRWLSSYVSTAREPKSRKLAAQRVRDFLEPRLGHLRLGSLKREDIRGYRLWLERQELSVLSVRHILSDCRCFLRWCEDDGLLDRSPFPRRILPKVQERPPDRLTAEELKSVCSLEEPYGFICRFLAQTGLRWGEFIRAKTTDISGEMLLIHRTKSGRVRRVPLAPSLRDELCARVGRVSPLTNADGFAKQVRRRSGVEHFHAHQLRHTFACRWLEAGGSLAALQEILGHASIVTTQRYGRLGEAHVQAEAERIGNQLVTQVVTPQLRRTS
jgi:integrase